MGKPDDGIGEDDASPAIERQVNGSTLPTPPKIRIAE
jgi:hypothetical protein